MGYKTIMLNLDSYARLSRARDALRKRSGLKLSFNDLVMGLVSNSLEFADMEDALKDFIAKFVEKVGKMDSVMGVLLFGSVARGEYNEYSDIDVLVVTESQRSIDFKRVMDTAAGTKTDSYLLMERGLPSLISPVVLSRKELGSFRPFYLDFAEYGMILYERGHLLSDFIYSIKRVRHRREYINNVDVLTWA